MCRIRSKGTDAPTELVSVCLLDWSLVKKPCNTWQDNAAFCQGLEAGLGLQIEQEQDHESRNVNQSIDQSRVDDEDFDDLLQELQSAAERSEDPMDIDLDGEYIWVSNEDLHNKDITSSTSTLFMEPERRDEYHYRWTGM